MITLARLPAAVAAGYRTFNEPARILLERSLSLSNVIYALGDDPRDSFLFLPRRHRNDDSYEPILTHLREFNRC